MKWTVAAAARAQRTAWPRICPAAKINAWVAGDTNGCRTGDVRFFRRCRHFLPLDQVSAPMAGPATMSEENKLIDQVTFGRGYDVCIMDIDGTWRRDCLLKAVSDNDAVLTVEGSVQGLNLKEFFLLLRGSLIAVVNSSASTEPTWTSSF